MSESPSKGHHPKSEGGDENESPDSNPNPNPNDIESFQRSPP
jgi:hypothetical protein